MKANELMIGDWVYAFGCKNVQVKEILEDGIYDFTTYSLSPFDEIEPILLTPEILEKNGFKTQKFYITNKWNNEYVLIKDEEKTIYWENGCVHCVQEEIDVYFACRYVHELQHVLKLFRIEKEIVL